MRLQAMLLAWVALATGAAAWAQRALAAPANDAFSSAQVVSGPSWTIAADNRTATREADEPLIAGLPGGHSLWYRWEAPATRRYHLSTWAGKSAVNTMLAVYTGPSLELLDEVASATGFRQRAAAVTDAAVSFTATAGTVYYITVDGETPATGPFMVSLIDSDWEFLGLGGSFVTPAIGPDETLYTAESIGFLYAINPDGSQKWRFLMDGYMVLGGPTVAPNGTVYIGDDANTFYAIDAQTGAERWRFQFNGEILSSPAIGADGTIYVRCENGKLYALTASGTEKWEVNLPAAAISLASPVVATDGTIYCGAADGKLYALDPNGGKKWAFDTGRVIYGAPALGTDGTIYLGSSSKRFFAISPAGVQLWALDLPDEVGGSPVIGPDGTIYFGCSDARLYAVSPDGQVRWTYATGAEIILGAPVVANDGTIYIGSDDSLVHAVRPDGTRARVFATGDHIAASPLLHGGVLYIPSFDYRLYAVSVGQVPASSAWPMERQNATRTGRVLTTPLAIGVQPRSQTVPLGSFATFNVGATGAPPLSYQWYRDGQPIADARGEAYVVGPVDLQSVGQYTVQVTDVSGFILSQPALLSVSGNVPGSDLRLSNLYARAVVSPGADLLIPGITIAGPEPKQILIRAAGPALTGFGVGGVLAQPQLRLLRGETEIARNAGWDTGDQRDALVAAFEKVGAFGFKAGSADAALLVTLPPGSYTAQVSGLGKATGTTAVEVYELGPTSSRLVSLSCRARVGTGSDTLIPGITVTGTGAKQFLIRAAGPSLANFGVRDVLARPHLTLFAGSKQLADNTGWTSASNAAAIEAATARAGAFAFAPGAADCALLVTLSPGTYTVQVNGLNDTTGAALMEIYEVP